MAKKSKKTRRVAKNFVAPSTSTSSMSEPMTEAHMTFSQLLAAFVLFTVLHALIIFVANMFFPASVVLGNNIISTTTALLMSSATLALIAVGATPLIESGSEAINWKLSNGQWMGTYLIINIFAIWAVARLAEAIGLGISSWLVAVILGTIINVAQGMIIVSVVSRLADRSA